MDTLPQDPFTTIAVSSLALAQDLSTVIALSLLRFQLSSITALAPAPVSGAVPVPAPAVSPSLALCSTIVSC